MQFTEMLNEFLRNISLTKINVVYMEGQRLSSGSQEKQIFGDNACHPEPIRCAQGKLRAGSGSMGAEILRFAQDDSPDPPPVRFREPYLQTSPGKTRGGPQGACAGVPAVHWTRRILLPGGGGSGRDDRHGDEPGE